LSIGMTQQFFVFFVPGDLGLWPLTPKLELGRDFCTAHLTAKFHRPMFNRSEVMVRTSWQTDTLTNKQTMLKTYTSLRYTLRQCVKYFKESSHVRIYSGKSSRAARQLQPCVHDDWLCQWEMAIFDPQQNRHPSTDHQNLPQVIMWRPLQLCQNWCTSVHGELMGEWVKYNQFLSITLFSETHLQVRRVDGFSRTMAQTTRTRTRMCRLGFRWYGFPFRGSNPKNRYIIMYGMTR